jgi:tight adherence protein B
VIVVGVVAAGLAASCACLVLFGPRLPLPAPVLGARVAVASLAAGVLGVAIAAAAGYAPLGLAAAALPPWWMERAHRAARREAEASVLPALEAVAGAARAGLVLREAIALGRDRARGELAGRMAAALANEELGEPLAPCLGRARAGAPARIESFFADLELCASARLGSERVAAFLDDVRDTLRFDRELASDLRARTAGPRVQIWLLAAVVPLLALYLSAMSPTLAGELSSPLGRGLLIPAGALFELAGLVMSRRILARACG